MSVEETAPRTRRSLLAAGAGGLLAAVAATLGRPQAASAANGDPLVLGNDERRDRRHDDDDPGPGPAVGVTGGITASTGADRDAAERRPGSRRSGPRSGRTTDSGKGLWAVTRRPARRPRPDRVRHRRVRRPRPSGTAFVSARPTTGQGRRSSRRATTGKRAAIEGFAGPRTPPASGRRPGSRASATCRPTRSASWGVSAVGTGVFGDTTNGYGVAGLGYYGVYGSGAAGVVGDVDGGTGVVGWTGVAFAPDPAVKVGVWAGAENGRTALDVHGVARFSRSGKVSFSAGQASKTITVAGGITATSLGFADDPVRQDRLLRPGRRAEHHRGHDQGHPEQGGHDDDDGRLAGDRLMARLHASQRSYAGAGPSRPPASPSAAPVPPGSTSATRRPDEAVRPVAGDGAPDPDRQALRRSTRTPSPAGSGDDWYLRVVSGAVVRPPRWALPRTSDTRNHGQPATAAPPAPLPDAPRRDGRPDRRRLRPERRHAVAVRGGRRRPIGEPLADPVGRAVADAHAIADAPRRRPSTALVPADLDGVLVAPELAHRLPLAVMIDDSRAARPQSGFNARLDRLPGHRRRLRVALHARLPGRRHQGDRPGPQRALLPRPVGPGGRRGHRPLRRRPPDPDLHPLLAQAVDRRRRAGPGQSGLPPDQDPDRAAQRLHLHGQAAGTGDQARAPRRRSAAACSSDRSATPPRRPTAARRSDPDPVPHEHGQLRLRPGRQRLPALDRRQGRTSTRPMASR